MSHQRYYSREKSTVTIEKNSPMKESQTVTITRLPPNGGGRIHGPSCPACRKDVLLLQRLLPEGASDYLSAFL